MVDNLGYICFGQALLSAPAYGAEPDTAPPNAPNALA